MADATVPANHTRKYKSLSRESRNRRRFNIDFSSLLLSHGEAVMSGLPHVKNLKRVCEMDKNLSVSEVAKITGFSRQRIRFFIKTKVIEAVRFVKRGKWLIPKSEISRINAGLLPKKTQTRELRIEDLNRTKHIKWESLI